MSTVTRRRRYDKTLGESAARQILFGYGPLIESGTSGTRIRKAAARVTIWGRVFQRLLYALYKQRIPLLLVLLISVSAGTYYLWLNQSNLPAQAAAAGTAPVEVTVTDLQGTVNNATLTLKEDRKSTRLNSSHEWI